MVKSIGALQHAGVVGSHVILRVNIFPPCPSSAHDNSIIVVPAVLTCIAVHATPFQLRVTPGGQSQPAQCGAVPLIENVTSSASGAPTQPHFDATDEVDCAEDDCDVADTEGTDELTDRGRNDPGQ